MCCSASQAIEPASSAGLILGIVISLARTAPPGNDSATCRPRMAAAASSVRIVSATAASSTIAPLTMLPAGTGRMPAAATTVRPPDCVNSTALTELEPMSMPTSDAGRGRKLASMCMGPATAEYRKQAPCHPPPLRPPPVVLPAVPAALTWTRDAL